MSPTPAARPGGRAAAPRRLLVINLWACLLLLAQYLLGMVANLYVTIPAQHPGASAGNYFGGAASGIGWVIPDGPAWLAAHAALGLALVVAALAAVVWQRGSGSRLIMFTSVLGALAILGAAFNGVSFLNYGQSFSSMIMAGLWALALGCYVVGLFAAARAAEGPGRVMPSAPAGHGP
jgi:hypothetical protein